MPVLLILNQMAGPLTWQFAEDYARAVGPVAMLTGHPDTLAKGSRNDILLFPSAPHMKGSYPRRVVSWVRYCCHATCWLGRWPRKTPILVFSNPPILPWVAWLFRVLRGQRYAVMVHDIYPDILVRIGKLPEAHLVVLAWRALNRRAYQRADVVMTLGEHMARRLRRCFDPAQTRHGRIEVVTPWADTNAIRPIPKQENWFAKKFEQLGKLTVMYSGNMGLSHDIEMMLLVAEQLRDNGGIHFMFIGSGPKWALVAETIEQKGLNNVTVLPWQPEEVVPFSLPTADVAFISLKEELTGMMLPSKAFSFMAAGVPLLITSAMEGELADLVRHFSLGWNIRPGETGAICALLQQVRQPDILQPYRVASRRAAEKVGTRANSRGMTDLLSLAFKRDLGPADSRSRAQSQD